MVNQKPIANAGNDQSISMPAVTSALLDGSKSSDPDGTIAAYCMEADFRSIGSRNTFAGECNHYGNGLTVEGEYYFELTVTDNKGETAKGHRNIGSTNTLRVTQSIQVFPNPASDIMKLRFTSDKTGKMNMRIYDALVRFIQATDLEKTTTIYEKTIDVSHLSPGPYFLRLEFEDGNHVIQKFIKL